MVLSERFSNLPESTWPRLRSLLDSHSPGGEPLAMSIGDPQHPFPAFVTDEIVKHAAGFNSYPPNDGAPELLEAMAGFVSRRYGVALDPSTQLMALNGTREGLFNALVALLPDRKGAETPFVLMPNPFYQVYMVGSLAVSAEPIYMPCVSENGFLPDFAALDAETLDRTAAAIICSPSNPQGAIATRDYLARLLELAERHDFVVLADECYSEIYRDTPPPGLLQIAAEVGASPERAVAFHSLSKRSNLPGMRSGFIAGGPKTIAQCKILRAYAGAPLPLPLQRAAQKVWEDEAHVVENREMYRAKFRLADEIFGDVPGFEGPAGGFFLWLPVPDGEAATLKLWRETGVRALPGAYLAQTVNGENPGAGYVRVAMVAPIEDLKRGLKMIRECLYEQG